MMINDEVKAIICDISGLDTVDEMSFLQDDIGLDSLGLVTLLIELEDAFSITLDESDMNPFELLTVMDVIDMVNEYIEASDEVK